MAFPVGSQLNLQKIPILGIVPESSVAGSPPGSPVNGQLWYDTTNTQLKIYTGASFVAVGSGAGGPPTGAAGGDLNGSSYPNPVITTNAVTYAKFQQVAANALVGNPTGSLANATGVTLAADHSFSAGALQLGAFTGDITKSAASLATTIAAGVVTYAKIQNVTASRLLGNPTGSPASTSEILLGSDLGFTGGTTLQTSAFTGDVTKAAGGTATTIAANAVTYAKMQTVTAARLIGNPTGGATTPSEISLSADLAFSGTSLQVGAFTGDITKAAGSLATTIGANAVTLAKLATAVSLSGLASTNASTADITASGFKITNLGTPTLSTDATTKAYVDGVATGLDPKASVRFASTATVAGTYTATGGTSARGQFTAMSNAAIDGVTPAGGDRVLLKNQGTAAQNGVWVITTLGTGANGVWDRATDFDQDAEVTAGAFTFVEQGTVNADTGWVLTTDNPIIIGGASGTSLTWTQFSGAGTYLAGNGLNLTGSTFSVVGTTNRISVSGAGVDISASYVGQATITTLGTVTTGTWTGTSIAVANGGTGSGTAAGARTNLGTTGRYFATLGALTAGSESTITHSLGSTEVVAVFRDASTNFQILLAWRVVDANTIGVTADIAYSGSAVKVVVLG